MEPFKNRIGPLQHRSIRRLFSGLHEVELQVNGARSPMGRFKLEV